MLGSRCSVLALLFSLDFTVHTYRLLNVVSPTRLVLIGPGCGWRSPDLPPSVTGSSEPNSGRGPTCCSCSCCCRPCFLSTGGPSVGMPVLSPARGAASSTGCRARAGKRTFGWLGRPACSERLRCSRSVALVSWSRRLGRRTVVAACAVRGGRGWRLPFEAHLSCLLVWARQPHKCCCCGQQTSHSAA